MAETCITVTCIDKSTVTCVDITDLACTDSNIVAVTVVAPCNTTATLLVNNGSGACNAGGVNDIEVVGCCGTVQWISINAVGHTGTATILDTTANPTQFVSSSRGAYEIVWDCCE